MASLVMSDINDNYYFLGINSVVRSNCSNGDVRLVGGSGSHEGRVEVCINEAWGSICSNGWDDKDADIVCKQLGFLPIGQYIPVLCTYCIIIIILFYRC